MNLKDGEDDKMISRLYIILLTSMFIMTSIYLSGCNELEPRDNTNIHIPGNNGGKGFHLPYIDVSQPAPKIPVSVNISRKHLGNIEITYNDIVYAPITF